MAAPKASTLQQRFGFMDPDLKTQTHDEIMIWLDSNCEKIVEELFPLAKSTSDDFYISHDCELKILKTWEKPVKSPKDFMIGFIDFEATRVFRDKVKGNGNFYQASGLNPWKIYFEVKTKIESLGELIRQIRMYKEFCFGPFVVVCPDDRFKDNLSSQGIYFYKYQP